MNEVELAEYCHRKGLYREQIEAWIQKKEKALAEAASLLLLQKKAQAIWGDEEEEW